jgi:hypothetical protein
MNHGTFQVRDPLGMLRTVFNDSWEIVFEDQKPGRDVCYGHTNMVHKQLTAKT